MIGSYKNDAKTRAFFKKTIGNHFHFNAKTKSLRPKQEWALITFVQKYMGKHPQATKAEVNKAWHKKRLEMVMVVIEYFKK